MIYFIVPGNQENLQGNPIGYHRTTQKSKWDDRHTRYEAWKDYVWACLLKVYPLPPRFGGKTAINCYIEFVNKKHPDPGNITKGIADALCDKTYYLRYKGTGSGCIGTDVQRRLYPNDKQVLERTMDYNYSDVPGVLVVIHEM